MATGFIGTVEIDDVDHVGRFDGTASGSSATLTYTAPSDIQYAVASVSETATINLSPPVDDNNYSDIYFGVDVGGLVRDMIFTGFGVSCISTPSAHGYSNGAFIGNRHSSTSKDSKIILAPNETITLSASYFGPSGK
jgi:hypothetical protein